MEQQIMDRIIQCSPLEYRDNGVDDAPDSMLKTEIMLDIKLVRDMLSDGESLEEIGLPHQAICWTDLCYAWTHRRSIFNPEEWQSILHTLGSLIKH